jgi:hypothetical protein
MPSPNSSCRRFIFKYLKNVVCRVSSFWKQKLQLQAKLPICTELRFFCIVIG